MKRGIIFCILIVIFLLSLHIATACVDEDGDGYGLNGAADCAVPDILDCNDNNFNVNPSIEESCDNLIDDNCNGEVDEGCDCVDNDRDGYYAYDESLCIAGDDCDDSSAFVNPEMDEICDNEIDDNCDEMIDGDDPGCISEGEDDTCHFFAAYWADCDAYEINSAVEGDSVYLIAITQNCDDDTNLNYKVYEYDEDKRDLIEELEEEYFLHDSYYDMTSWASMWQASWQEDDEDEIEPEYYFEVNIDGTKDYMDSGTSSSKLLRIDQCSDCEELCELAGHNRIGGDRLEDVGGVGGWQIVDQEECVPEWDCSSAEWSECDEVTHTKSRDTSLCVYIGEGNPESCAVLHRATVTSEKSCLPEEEEAEAPVRREKEEEVSGFPWLIIILIGIAVLVLLGIIAYMIKKQVLKKGAVKESPFKSKKDLDAVVKYVKSAKAKGYKEAQIAAALKTRKWTPKHINYALKMAKKK